MKPLLPSLKEKKRYLVFEIISDKPLKYKEVEKSLKKELSKVLGLFNSARAGLMFLPETWNKKKQKGIIRVAHKYVSHLKSGLMLIEEIKNQKVIIKSVKVSGILNKAKQAI